MKTNEKLDAFLGIREFTSEEEKDGSMDNTFGGMRKKGRKRKSRRKTKKGKR